MRKKGIAIFVLIMFMCTMILPSAYAAPPWWDKAKRIVRADIVGAVGGYLATQNGLGALFGGVGGSVDAAGDEGEGAVGPGWTGTEASDSIGYHHNMALDAIYEGIGSIDVNSEAGQRRVNQLLEAYIDDNVLDVFIASGAHAPGTESAKADLFLKIEGMDGEASVKSVDPSFEEIMRRINEALNQGKISNKFYNDFLIALEILENDADDPLFLINSAADFLWRETSQRMTTSPPSETLSLNFEKIKFAYENQDEDESDIGLNAASKVMVTILNTRPIATDESAAVEVMDLILAAVFDDVAKMSYDYWMKRSVLEEEDVTTPVGRINIVLTIGKNISSVNQQNVMTDVPPFIENQRTYLPFRFIGEQLGATVEWVPEERKVTYELEGTNISLWIDQNRAMVNGVEVFVDSNNTETVPFIRDNRTMVPVRFISEALGFYVEWNAATQQVGVSSEPIEVLSFSWGS